MHRLLTESTAQVLHFFIQLLVKNKHFPIHDALRV